MASQIAIVSFSHSQPLLFPVGSVHELILVDTSKQVSWRWLMQLTSIHMLSVFIKHKLH